MPLQTWLDLWSRPITTTPTFHLEINDAVDFLWELPRESVDCVVTDPAYESIERWRAIGTTTRLSVSKGSSNPWFNYFPNKRLESFLWALWLALKPNTHAYVFCDWDTLLLLRHIVVDRLGGTENVPGRNFFRVWSPIVWHKTRYLGMGGRYRRCHEYILFLEKGKRRLNSNAERSVKECQPVFNGYPAEKPVPLLKELIGASTKDGDLVVDPFLGSGSTGAAALSCGRRFAGCDSLESAVYGAARRLGNARK